MKMEGGCGRPSRLHRLCSPVNDHASDRDHISSPDDEGFFANHVVPRYSGEQDVEKKVLEQLDSRDMFGNTPLHYACQKSSSENEPIQLIHWLLSVGADPNSENCHGETPMHMAARRGLNETCRLLFKHGGSVYHIDNFGATPREDGQHGKFASAMKELFSELMESRVAPLQCICRETIVKALGPRASVYVTKIDSLPLPVRLKGFIGGHNYQERARLAQISNEKSLQGMQHCSSGMLPTGRRQSGGTICTVL